MLRILAWSQNNTHDESKRAWYSAEVGLKGTIRYLPYPNATKTPTISSQWRDIAGYQDCRRGFWLANCEFGYGNGLRYYQFLQTFLKPISCFPNWVPLWPWSEATSAKRRSYLVLITFHWWYVSRNFVWFDFLTCLKWAADCPSLAWIVSAGRLKIWGWIYEALISTS